MPDHFYVYPAYLERKASRAGGRRVPAGEATPDVTREEILAAAERLGYQGEAEAEKQYPRRAHAYGGRVKIAKRGKTTKAAFLRALAAEVRRARPAGPTKGGH